MLRTIPILLIVASCGARDLNTDLLPEGPPMVLQIFMKERIPQNVGSLVTDQLAFGTHPSVDETDDGVVTNATVTNQKIRIIMDELLLGRNLEEIQCAEINGMTTWERIPEGTTPEVLDRCTRPGTENCTELCTTLAPVLFDNGDPVLDANGNPVMTPIGLANLAPSGFSPVHSLRFIQGAVTITCDGDDMPLNTTDTFWQPSGNQLLPAGNQGITGLGPAIVLQPANGLKTGADCTINFDPSVTDRDGETVCTPDFAAIAQDIMDLGFHEAIENLECASAGDASGAAFTTETLAVANTSPASGATITPAQTSLSIIFNAPIDPALLTPANFALSDSVGPVAGYSVVPRMDNAAIVDITNLTLVGSENYSMTISSAVADPFGGTLPAAFTFTFSTSP